MTGAHTPGPWERRVDPTNSVIRIEEAANRGNQGMIAYVTPLTLLSIANGNIPRDDGTNFANARIIALAPEMLAGLNWYAETFCEFGPSNEGCGKFGDDICAGCKARSLVNRACPTPLPSGSIER